MWVFCLHVWLSMWSVAAEGLKRLNPWDCRYRPWWVAKCMLGIKLGPSVTASDSLNCWAISPVPAAKFFCMYKTHIHKFQYQLDRMKSRNPSMHLCPKGNIFFFLITLCWYLKETEMNWGLAYSFQKGLVQTNLTEEQDEAVSSYPQTRYPWVLDRCWR